MNWKVPGWAAAAGAVISVVAALVGGNPFGAILLRAVVSALVAGALGLAALYVLRRFLPGIAASPAPPQPTVDILLDEEVPLAAQAGGGQAGRSPAEPGYTPAELAQELEAEPVESLGEESGFGEVAGVGESAGGEPAAGFPLDEGEGGAGPTESEPFPELPEAEGLAGRAEGGLAGRGPARPGNTPAGRSPAAPVPEVEELPGGGLEALSAAGPEDELSEPSLPASPSHRALKAEELEAQLDSVTKGQDPASLAQAVRTFLRKDQEG